MSFPLYLDYEATSGSALRLTSDAGAVLLLEDSPCWAVVGGEE